MLTEILSSDKILQKGGEKSQKSLSKIGEESAQFSRILKSLDQGVVGNSSKSGTANLMDNLKAIFEDDKEFLKESISFLNGKEREPNLLGGDLETSDISSDKSSPLFGLNFGNYKPLNSGGDEENRFKVLINQAKDFLKGELMKHSVSEKDMPNTLRGLVELASSKGISLKDIKFSLDDKGQVNKVQSSTIERDVGDSSKVAKFIINQHSTEALLRGKSEALVLRAKKTDQTPENLTGLDGGVKEQKSLSLQSLLSNGDIQKSEKSAINLSNEPKSLGDILKVKDELKLDDKKVNKNLKAHEKVTQFTGVSKEIVASLFSDEELKDLGIDTKLSKSENIISETETISEETSSITHNDKIKSGLELKIGEAKTMTRHLASNLQEQIENYKHPFQKLTLTLNPQKLGEVDVDIIKRGNSVKISLSGNSNTINLLSANSFELRNQLINVGLQDPTFKFNEDGRNGSQHQQRNQQNRDEVVDEEKQESFEIDVLQYI